MSEENQMNFSRFDDIPNFNSFVVVKPIDKGFSTEEKFYLKNRDGHEFLLRLADISELDKRKNQFEMLRKVEKLNINSQIGINFGVCENGKKVFSLLSWISGDELGEKIGFLSDAQQYNFGVNAGEVLKKLHGLSAPKQIEPWHINFNRRLDAKIKRVQECDFKSKHEKRIIAFVNDNRELLLARQQCFQHGDFHANNLVITPDNLVGVIDFNKSGYGDPYEEFSSIIWDVRASEHFARGKIDGYFPDGVPTDFFPLLALYVSIHVLGFLPWATKLQSFCDDEGEQYLKNVDIVMGWYDNFANLQPKWLAKK